jgi:hypothetical protein
MIVCSFEIKTFKFDPIKEDMIKIYEKAANQYNQAIKAEEWK